MKLIKTGKMNYKYIGSYPTDRSIALDALNL